MSDTLSAQAGVGSEVRKVSKKEIDAIGTKKVKVRFHATDTLNGAANEVRVGVNGVTYRYQYDTEVEVPVAVLHAIDNAVMVKYTQNLAKPNEGLKATHVKRYGYEKVGK